MLVEKCKVSQDGVLGWAGQHLPRGRVGVLGLDGVLDPTLDHSGDERAGSSAYTSEGGGPATVMVLLRGGGGERRLMPGAGQGVGSCWEASHASIYWGGGSFGGMAMASSYGGSRT